MRILIQSPALPVLTLSAPVSARRVAAQLAPQLVQPEGPSGLSLAQL